MQAEIPSDVQEVIDFWFGKVESAKIAIDQEKQKLWYRGGVEFDNLIRNTYGDKLKDALEGRLSAWEEVIFILNAKYCTLMLNII